jgi:hypothetical protein
MKIKYFAILMLAVVGLLAVSCSKSEDNTPVPVPKYPQLAGTWSGKTSQDSIVRFVVTAQGSSLVLTAYRYAMTYTTTGYFSTQKVDIDGQTVVFTSDNAFAFSNGLSPQDSLKGNFNVSSMVLSGTITKEFKKLDGTVVGTGSVTYTATKE